MTEPALAASSLAAAIAAAIPRLRRYATALLGNASDADDLVQDCVERALSRADTLRDPDRLTAWLLTILHNLHVSGIRGRQRRGIAVAVDSLADDLALSVPPEDRPATRDFVRGVAALTPEHRQVLLMVCLEGLSYREVGEILDIPIGTVMSRLARARERLRVLLEGGEDQVVRRIK
jgi:RNA polymerase sigma factor (sigma-70 family)